MISQNGFTALDQALNNNNDAIFNLLKRSGATETMIVRNRIEKERERIEKENRERFEKETRERIEGEIRERIEKETRECIEKENRERTEGESRERIEKETRERTERIEKGTSDRIEKETAARLEKERGSTESLSRMEKIEVSSEQLQPKASHVFLPVNQLPSYFNADALEVSTDEYRMIEEIDSGGFATVFKGIHTTSNREVVIKKIIKAASSSNNEAIFVAEMVKVRSLFHPGIPKVEAFYRSNKDMCLVFQDSSGLSVRNIMDENERTSKVPKSVPSLLPSDLMRLTVRLIEILDYVHSKGVIHYDIKPENVLLCNSEYGVQLIDFGSAGFVTITNKTNQLHTVEYSPPEKLDILKLDNIKKKDRKSITKLDVWLFGATLLNASCNALLLTERYDDNDNISPYFSLTSLAKGIVTLSNDDTIPWHLDMVLSKYFEVCSKAKAVWADVDTDIKDIIKVCLTHDISKRPYIHDIIQMQSFQRLSLKCR